MNAQPPQNKRGILTAMSSTFLLADAASVAVVEGPPAVAAMLLGGGGPPTVGAIVAIAMLVEGFDRGPKYLHSATRSTVDCGFNFYHCSIRRDVSSLCSNAATRALIMYILFIKICR